MAVLIHQLPPKPAYLRVKVWRRLQGLGAVAIKNSVYLMPKTDSATEDFQWMAREMPRTVALRVKVWRRLQSLGAVAIKNSVYVMPKTDGTMEDFQWVAREIAKAAARRRSARPVSSRACRMHRSSRCSTRPGMRTTARWRTTPKV